MPSNVVVLATLCRKIRAASDEDLRALDHSSVTIVKEALVALRKEIDNVLQRLAIVEDMTLH